MWLYFEIQMFQKWHLIILKFGFSWHTDKVQIKGCIRCYAMRRKIDYKNVPKLFRFFSSCSMVCSMVVCVLFCKLFSTVRLKIHQLKYVYSLRLIFKKTTISSINHLQCFKSNNPRLIIDLLYFVISSNKTLLGKHCNYVC